MPNSKTELGTSSTTHHSAHDLPSTLKELQGLLEQALLVDHIRIGRRIERALERYRSGQPVRLPIEKWLEQIRASISLRRLRSKLAERVSYPPELPITQHREELVELIRTRQVVIVAGDTGSGKSTQLPKMCLEAGRGQRGRIGCTQPRRLAALAISQRLAEELGVQWGYEVGCKIRFNDSSRPETTIKVMTDGILLAEIRTDPFLTEYDTIIVDEAHERSLNIDFLLGHLRQLLNKRADLKLIITSATLNTKRFAEAFDAPVINISGRLYPIEVRFISEDQVSRIINELGYVEGAVRTALDLVATEPPGDILIFMPTERDIRETCAVLQKELGDQYEVLPLFARLSADQQQRIFHPGLKPRIIVATNVAETSLTVPRIRYVIDTGLARISRYDPATRSRRLPIEPVSRSSAIQRMGRCGRTQGGVCVRLYTKQDYESRPQETEPEILRSNLADVVLRMKAFGLGEPETFPFLDKPAPGRIRAAYAQLKELGALDPSGELTPLGRDLAYLPVDPAIGRMILEARRQNALREVLIIAAGLSIQDPRETPYDRLDQARRMHARFDHPESDFLTLLNIWNAYHQVWETLNTQSQLREFCRRHFLSYNRMREWIDLHEQLLESLKEVGGFHLNTQPASPETIHRCILSGLLGHVGRRVSPNVYEGINNKQFMIHPSSTIFQASSTQERPQRRPQSKKQPQWIVAGELVETGRRYARMIGPIRPEWIQELAPQLCRTSYVDPYWDASQGRVSVTERIVFRGLVLSERCVAYRNVYPERAKEIFIQKALIEGGDSLPFEFPKRNLALLRRLRYWHVRQPQPVSIDLEERLYDFYHKRLPEIASTAELQGFIRRHGEKALFASPEDLLGPFADRFDPTWSPESVQAHGISLRVSYHYDPQTGADWVQIIIPLPALEYVNTEELRCSIPALREQYVLYLLQKLPRSLISRLMPLRETAARIAHRLEVEPSRFFEALSEFMKREFGLDLESLIHGSSSWPDHLQIRFAVVDTHGQVLAEDQSIETLREHLRARLLEEHKRAWMAAAARYEQYNLRAWTIGNPPEKVLITSSGGVPVFGYPGLYVDQNGVSLRLFADPEAAAQASRKSVPVLAQSVLSRELAWYQKELTKDLQKQAGPLYAPLGPFEALATHAWRHLLKYAFPSPLNIPPLREDAFTDYVAEAKSRLRRAVPSMVHLIATILKLRLELASYPTPYPGMQQELEALVPKDFLLRVSFERLPHLVRYLKAMQIRAQRAAINPRKDREKAERIMPYLKAYHRLLQRARHKPELLHELEQLRWLIEEYKVLCFAQELGTAQKVSEKRIEELIRYVESKLPPE